MKNLATGYDEETQMPQTKITIHTKLNYLAQLIELQEICITEDKYEKAGNSCF